MEGSSSLKRPRETSTNIGRLSFVNDRVSKGRNRHHHLKPAMYYNDRSLATATARVNDNDLYHLILKPLWINQVLLL